MIAAIFILLCMFLSLIGLCCCKAAKEADEANDEAILHWKENKKTGKTLHVRRLP